MDPKHRSHGKAPQSGSDSNSNSPAASPQSPGGGSKAAGGANVFANDGSFMEMFKKKMEEERRKKELQQAASGGGDASTAEEGQSTVEKKPAAVTSFVGKRRGGVFLKTGMVAKKLKDEEVEPGKSDAWSKYMAEVKKYKAHQCGDDDKTRPLVK